MNDQTPPGGKSTYVFSAAEQKEIRRIRQLYLTHPDSKLEQLRQLDRSVRKTGTINAVMLGLAGMALHGIGVSLVQGTTQFIPGTLLTLAGIGFMVAAVPVYRLVTRLERAKIAPQVLKLTEELMK